MLTLTTAQIDLWLGLLLWPLSRILGLIATDPFLGSRSIPARSKAAFAVMLTVLVAPSLAPMPAISVVSPAGVLVLLQQALIGLAIGFVMRVVFTAVEMAGDLAGLQMGLGFASFYDPQHAAQVPIVAQVASLFTLLVFLALNGHLMVLEGLIRSFQILPISAEPLHGVGWRLLVTWSGQIFVVGVWLALPVIAAMLVTNLSIGVMTRASPQFNLFAVGFPITLAVGFAALYSVLPYWVPHIAGQLNEGGKFVRQLVRAFAGI